MTKPKSKVFWLLSSFHGDSLPPAQTIFPPGCPGGFSDTCQKTKFIILPSQKKCTPLPPACSIPTFPSVTCPGTLDSPGIFVLSPATLLKVNPGFSLLQCPSKLFSLTCCHWYCPDSGLYHLLLGLHSYSIVGFIQ